MRAAFGARPITMKGRPVLIMLVAPLRNRATTRIPTGSVETEQAASCTGRWQEKSGAQLADWARSSLVHMRSYRRANEEKLLC